MRMLWTLRISAAVSVVMVTAAIAMTRPEPVELDAFEREARAAEMFPGWRCGVRTGFD